MELTENRKMFIDIGDTMNALVFGMMLVGVFLILAGIGGANAGMLSVGIVLLIISALIFISGNRQRKERQENEWRKEMLDKDKRR